MKCQDARRVRSDLKVTWMRAFTYDTSPIARTSVKESNLGDVIDEAAVCVKCTSLLEPHVTSSVTPSVVLTKVCACERGK